MPLDIAGFRHSSPHSGRPDGSRIHMDKKTTEMLLNKPIIVSVMRNGGRGRHNPLFLMCRVRRYCWFRRLREVDHSWSRILQLLGQARAERGADQGADVHIAFRLQTFQARSRSSSKRTRRIFILKANHGTTFSLWSRIDHVVPRGERKRKREFGKSLSAFRSRFCWLFSTSDSGSQQLIRFGEEPGK